MSKILIIDDEKSLRILYRKELEREGYSVVATEGRDALDAIEREHPDLVVLDLRPPPYDGLDSLGRILGTHRRIPVVLNTDYVSYVDDFRSWAADGVIFKSSDTSELRSKIRELLAARQGLGRPRKESAGLDASAAPSCRGR